MCECHTKSLLFHLLFLCRSEVIGLCAHVFLTFLASRRLSSAPSHFDWFGMSKTLLEMHINVKGQLVWGFSTKLSCLKRKKGVREGGEGGRTNPRIRTHQPHLKVNERAVAVFAGVDPKPFHSLFLQEQLQIARSLQQFRPHGPETS